MYVARQLAATVAAVGVVAAVLRAGYTERVPAVDTLLAQALELPDDEREELAVRLLHTLEPDSDELSSDAWDEAWSGEIDRRVREIRAGQIVLVDGADVMTEIRALTDPP
jgi:hypothetical protein